MKSVQDKRDFEKKIVSEMIDLYGNTEEMQELKAYACMRIDKCPFMESKSFCSACPVHCYQKEKREQIKAVMRYSGPRMIFHHPVLLAKHVWIDHGKKIQRAGYLLLGLLGLVLGAAGAVLPLIPAFPFLLLAAFCFARSNEKIHAWFLATRLYKDNLQSWVEHRAMDKPTKVRVLTALTLVFGIGLWFTRSLPVVQGIVFCVWLGHVLYFIFGMKTLYANV